MALRLIDHRRGSANMFSWLPSFDWSIVYENERWWNEVRYDVDDPWFVQVLDDGVEVAGLEFVDPGEISSDYTDLPVIGPERLEIQFLEVSMKARGEGIGTRAVQLLEDTHPDRRLFAYSENADCFWDQLGWKRFSPLEDGRRPLFIQPPR